MVATATAATVAVAAGPSSAAGDGSVTGYGPAGYAYFNAETELLAIHDSHADGYGVAVSNFRSDLPSTTPYYGWNREGNGTTTYYYPAHAFRRQHQLPRLQPRSTIDRASISSASAR